VAPTEVNMWRSVIDVDVSHAPQIMLMSESRIQNPGKKIPSEHEADWAFVEKSDEAYARPSFAEARR
jgi:hypothetical protein